MFASRAARSWSAECSRNSHSIQIPVYPRPEADRMPSSRALALSAAMLAASAALLAPITASPQDEGGLSFLNPGNEPVAMTTSDDKSFADASLTLRNGSAKSGRLRVRYITSQGAYVTAGNPEGTIKKPNGEVEQAGFTLRVTSDDQVTPH